MRKISNSLYANTWAPLIAFLLIAIVGGYSLHEQQIQTARKLHNSQLIQCGVTNTLLSESNKRAPLEQRTVDTLRSFLETARTAREAAYRAHHFHADKQAADGYAAQLRRLIGVSFAVIPPVDCQKVAPNV